jgi:DNA-binding transcriptional ArsR family regulator
MHQPIPISPDVLELIKQVKHPVRLPILLALGEGDASATELARRLDVPFDKVNHALRELTAAGYVQLTHTEQIAGSNLSRRIYHGTRQGWPYLVACLEAFTRGGGEGMPVAAPARR